MSPGPDTLEGSGHPLAFRLEAGGERAPLFGASAGSGTLRVEARVLGGHQKEAVVTEGEGFRWRLASDEGLILGGSDLAPAPLSFFCAGLQADLLGRLQALAPLHDVRLDAVGVAAENHFAFTGSFLSGTGQGSTQPAAIALRLRTAAAPAQALRLVQAALQASPAVAALRAPLANTFALYVNGRRSTVQGVHASPAPDAVDPFVAHARRPAPPAGAAVPQPPLIRHLKASEVAPAPLPATGGSASIVVAGQARAGTPAGTATIETRLARPPGSSFVLEADDRAQGAGAPSGLALLSAGVSFCYLTQLLRYVQHRKYQVGAIRLVQLNPYALLGSGPDGTLRGHAGPVDTHLFLHGAEPDAVMQELLFYSARTCFLHAALGSAFEPQVLLSVNGGPDTPVPLAGGTTP